MGLQRGRENGVSVCSGQAGRLAEHAAAELEKGGDGSGFRTEVDRLEEGFFGALGVAPQQGDLCDDEPCFELAMRRPASRARSSTAVATHSADSSSPAKARARARTKRGLSNPPVPGARAPA